MKMSTSRTSSATDLGQFTSRPITAMPCHRGTWHATQILPQGHAFTGEPLRSYRFWGSRTDNGRVGSWAGKRVVSVMSKPAGSLWGNCCSDYW